MDSGDLKFIQSIEKRLKDRHKYVFVLMCVNYADCKNDNRTG